jgi:hypothetical protein
MKKITLLLSVFVTLLSSCSKNDANTEVPVLANPNLVKKIETKTAPSTTTSIVFTYDGNKLIKSVDANAETTYNYTGNLITYIRILYTETSTQKTITFNYENNKLMSYTSVAPFVSEKKEYNYNANGVISSIHTITPRTGDVVTKYEFITLSNGNPVTIETSQNNLSDTDDNGVVLNNVTIQNILTYKYDDKKNPAKNILGFDKLLIVRDLLPFFNSANNVLVIKQNENRYSSRVVYSQAAYANLNFAYTYNPEGFPTVKEAYTDGKPTSTYSY